MAMAFQKPVNGLDPLTGFSFQNIKFGFPLKCMCPVSLVYGDPKELLAFSSTDEAYGRIKSVTNSAAASVRTRMAVVLFMSLHFRDAGYTDAGLCNAGLSHSNGIILRSHAKV